MADITCLIADLNLATGAPRIDKFELGGRSADEYILEASAAAGLRIQFDWSRRGLFPDKIALDGVNDVHLYAALGKLLGPIVPGAPPKIGLLLADQYQPAKDQYGIMFDLNASPGFYGPRQGCALFLTAIDLVTDATSFANFVAFTAIHEFGHALNLWHTAEGASGFMQAHPKPAHLDPSEFV